MIANRYPGGGDFGWRFGVIFFRDSINDDETVGVENLPVGVVLNTYFVDDREEVTEDVILSL
jgi:hypothetical protein